VGCNKKGETLCTSCLALIPPADPFPKDWVRPLFYYKDPRVRKALWALKYRNKRQVAVIFGNALYDSYLEDASEEAQFSGRKKWLVVPIPASRARMRKRGYNQASLLAGSFVAKSDASLFTFLPNALSKITDTKSQTETKSRTERLGNIRGSFAVAHPDEIRSKNIILIDDIASTGATLSEARRVLKESSAKNVIALTVAH